MNPSHWNCDHLELEQALSEIKLSYGFNYSSWYKVKLWKIMYLQIKKGPKQA